MELLVNKPKTKRGWDTLERICTAAEEIIYEKGYHGASISEITARARVASGTFYIYFDGKYNLYKYLLLRMSHEIRKHLSKSIKDCTTRREAERIGLKAWLEYIKDHKYMYHFIWESLYIDKQLFVDYYENFCESYTRNIMAGKESGEICDIDNTVLSYVLMGATNFLGLKWAIFNETDDFDMVLDAYMHILEKGIFTPKKDMEK